MQAADLKKQQTSCSVQKKTNEVSATNQNDTLGVNTDRGQRKRIFFRSSIAAVSFAADIFVIACRFILVGPPSLAIAIVMMQQTVLVRIVSSNRIAYAVAGTGENGQECQT